MGCIVAVGVERQRPDCVCLTRPREVFIRGLPSVRFIAHHYAGTAADPAARQEIWIAARLASCRRPPDRLRSGGLFVCPEVRKRGDKVDPSMFVRGLLIGLSIAAPVGPIGVLCIRRTLAEGRWVGLATGLGAATA